MRNKIVLRITKSPGKTGKLFFFFQIAILTDFFIFSSQSCQLYMLVFCFQRSVFRAPNLFLIVWWLNETLLGPLPQETAAWRNLAWPLKMWWQRRSPCCSLFTYFTPPNLLFFQPRKITYSRGSHRRTSDSYPPLTSCSTQLIGAFLSPLPGNFLPKISLPSSSHAYREEPSEPLTFNMDADRECVMLQILCKICLRFR